MSSVTLLFGRKDAMMGVGGTATVSQGGSIFPPNKKEHDPSEGTSLVRLSPTVHIILGGTEMSNTQQQASQRKLFFFFFARFL